jgi:hypothetical protein
LRSAVRRQDCQRPDAGLPVSRVAHTRAPPLMGDIILTNNQWIWEIFSILCALVIVFLVLAPKD